MKLCKLCQKPLTGRNKVFCSKLCLVTSNGKKTGGWNKKEKIELVCNYCGEKYLVIPSRLDDSKHLIS